MDRRAPANAARIMTQEEDGRPRFRRNTIVAATTISAPEEMPKTNGPAMDSGKKSAAEIPPEPAHLPERPPP